jgi:hypothetical protein
MKRISILITAALFALPSYAATIPTKLIADKAVTSAKIGSGAATSGQVCAADGSGGCSWQNQTGGSSGTAIQEQPSGNVNSSNTAFTIAHTPTASATVFLFIDGQLQTQGSGKDYTISGQNITMGTAPSTGQLLWVGYTY